MTRLLRILTLCFVYTLFACPAASANEPGAWQNLLDKDLSKWEVFIGVPHQSVKIPGRLAPSSKDGRTGEPLGLGNDPLEVFTVSMVDGEPVLHITGEIYGGLTTLDEFTSYHLSLQFRWGEKKWPPRVHQKRDSGLLFHCVGKHGAFWNVWMRSLECQIQEGDCGDFIPLAGSRATIYAKPGSIGKRPVYDPAGKIVKKAGYSSHSPSKEMPHGQWNTVEVYTIDDEAVFVVNGTPNMSLFNTRQNSPNGGKTPLTSGRIQIQSEAAEIEYRRVKIRQIERFPKELASHLLRPAAS